MRLILAIIFLSVTLELCNGKNRTRTQAGDAIYEVREILRKSNPMDIIRDASDAFQSLLPKELVEAETSHLREFGTSIIRNFTNPANVRVLMHYVRESKIRNKGEIIRMMMRFMNPDNLTPMGLVRTFKNLDSLTVSELNAVYLKYLKFIEPKIFGHDYDGLLKYINENDVQQIGKILFDIFKETDTRDLYWMIQRMDEEKEEMQRNAQKLLITDGDQLAKNWQMHGEEEIRKRVSSVIRDLQRIGKFEKFSSKGIELTDAFKIASIHFLDNFFDDLENITSTIDPNAAKEKLTHSVKQAADMISGLFELYDVDELGMDVERGLDYIKSLNTSSALAALENLRNILPPVEKLVDQVNRNEFIKSTDKPKIAEMLITLNRTRLPDTVNEFLMDQFIKRIKKIDAKRVRRMVEFFAKESQIDNDVYLVLKSIGANLISDGRKHGLDLNGKNWKDLKKEIEHNVEMFDGKLTEEFLHEVIADIEHLDANAVADVIADSNTVLTDIFTDDLLITALENPMEFLDLINKTVFSDMVKFQLDLMKVINIEDFSRRCHNLSLLADIDLKAKVKNTTKWVADQFDRVANGSIAAKKLKIKEISELLSSFMESTDINGLCIDIAGILRANRVFTLEEREEIADTFWKSFQMMKNSTSVDGIVDKETLKSVKTMIQALSNALVKIQRKRPNDFRAAVIRLAVRHVQDLSDNGLLMKKPQFNYHHDEDDVPRFVERLKKIIKIHPTPLSVLLNDTTISTQKMLDETEITTASLMTISETTLIEKATFRPEIVTKMEISENVIMDKKFEYFVVSDENSECKKDVDVLIGAYLGKNLTDDEIWAEKMLDSWTTYKKPKMYDIKHRECLSVKQAAQFCNTTVGVNETAGICIPASCSVLDWNRIVQNLPYGFSWQTVESCVAKLNTGDNKWEKYSWIFMIVIAVLVAFSTFYEQRQRSVSENEEPNKIATAFSLSTTFKHLFRPYPDQWPMGIDGVRVFALFFIILHHTFENSKTYLNDSKDGYFGKELRYIPAMNVGPAVDAFLFSSGLLTTWTFLNAVRLKGRYDVIAVPLRQAIIWALSLLAVMLLRSGLLRSEDVEESVCGSSWWHHILFFSNFASADYSCLPQGWYLSLEMQMLIFSAFVFFLFQFVKKYRWMFSLLLMITFTCTSFGILFHLDSIHVFPNFWDDQFVADTVKPYTRAVPWIVGITTGFLIFKQKDYEFQLKLHPLKAFIAMALAHTLCVGCVYAAAAFLNPSQGKWQLPMYLAFSRLGFSFGLSVIVILCASGNGGIFTKFMSMEIFKILNRTVISSFIVHFMVIFLRLRHFPGVYMDDYSLILAFCADFVISNVLGVIFYVFLKRPIISLVHALSFQILPLPRSVPLQRDAIPFE